MTMGTFLAAAEVKVVEDSTILNGELVEGVPMMLSTSLIKGAFIPFNGAFSTFSRIALHTFVYYSRSLFIFAFLFHPLISSLSHCL